MPIAKEYLALKYIILHANNFGYLNYFLYKIYCLCILFGEYICCSGTKKNLFRRLETHDILKSLANFQMNQKINKMNIMLLNRGEHCFPNQIEATVKEHILSKIFNYLIIIPRKQKLPFPYGEVVFESSVLIG